MGKFIQFPGNDNEKAIDIPKTNFLDSFNEEEMESTNESYNPHQDYIKRFLEHLDLAVQRALSAAGYASLDMCISDSSYENVVNVSYNWPLGKTKYFYICQYYTKLDDASAIFNFNGLTEDEVKEKFFDYDYRYRCTDVVFEESAEKVKQILFMLWDHYHCGRMAYVFPLSDSAYAQTVNPYCRYYIFHTAGNREELTINEKMKLSGLMMFFAD
ncbi:MAG: hypothetical protein LUF92_03845 [Clostridiales bacterium]|nr:hypothetical protein [Clostridiales bacterium]